MEENNTLTVDLEHGAPAMDEEECMQEFAAVWKLPVCSGRYYFYGHKRLMQLKILWNINYSQMWPQHLLKLEQAKR